MGLFKKSKIKDPQLNEYTGKTKTRRTGLLTSFDRIQYTTIQNCDENQLFDICDTILGGRAVLANFDKVNSEEANHMLSFISGVVYATDGEVFKLDNRLFLFGRKEEFEDGSLHQYVEDTK